LTIPASRWVAKKSARAALMVASEAQRRAGVRRDAEPCVRVLTYHRFGASTRDPWCVGRSAFEAQMAWLAEQELAVGLDDVVGYARGQRELKSGSVLVTMDDGFSSVWTEAMPIMRAYGIPSVAFITTSLVGLDSSDLVERYLHWDEVARLPENGVTVGSHAHTHRSLGRMGLEEAREEGTRSLQLLRERVGDSVTSFAYPYGMRPDHSPDTARVLGECGFSSVFIAQHGVIRRGDDVLALPRVKVEGGEPLLFFKMLCAGGMDAWRKVDDALWFLQKAR
jgi:peptidoglycan/xylan/chitin deacetylase (PgdA/CDA1 family)